MCGLKLDAYIFIYCTQHRPIRNTARHTTWTRLFWIIHEVFRCLYSYLEFNYKILDSGTHLIFSSEVNNFV